MAIIKLLSTTVPTMNPVAKLTKNLAAYCPVLLKIHHGIQLTCITADDSQLKFGVLLKNYCSVKGLVP